MNEYEIGKTLEQLVRGDINIVQAQVALVAQGCTRQHANTYTARVQAHTWSIPQAIPLIIAGVN